MTTSTTTAFDDDPHIARFAGRCQNCGFTKRDHAIKQPHRCPTTRQKESYWREWTPEAIGEVTKNEF